MTYPVKIEIECEPGYCGLCAFQKRVSVVPRLGAKCRLFGRRLVSIERRRTRCDECIAAEKMMAEIKSRRVY